MVNIMELQHFVFLYLYTLLPGKWIQSKELHAKKYNESECHF